MDGVDLNRLLAARTARQLEAVEERRKRFLAGKLPANQMDKAEWDLIELMDGMVD